MAESLRQLPATDLFDGNAAEALCRIIQKDDVKAFDAYAERFSLGAVRFGRFPVLSLIYLYGAKKLEKKYEETFLKANSWQEVPEPLFLSLDFRKKAGRVLRLYETEIVSPLEMLLVLDRSKKAEKNYPLTRLSRSQEARLASVWSAKYSLGVTTDASGLHVDKRPLSYGEKRRYLLSALSVLLVVAVLVGTPFVVNVFVPFINVKRQETDPDKDKTGDDIDDTEDPTTPDDPQESTDVKYYLASSFDDVEFSSGDVYTLNADVVLPASFHAETMRCTLRGAGHSVTVSQSEPLFGKIEGTIQNLVLVAAVPSEIVGDYALLATENAGTIDGVTARLSGEANVRAREDLAEGEATHVTAFSVTNLKGGVVKNCTAEYALTLRGELAANASFAGLVSVNQGQVSSCVVTGGVTSSDCDLAGACELNSYSLVEVVNRCALSQTSGTQGWSPMCAGVTLQNTYLVRGCVNEGAITAVSEYVFTGEYDDDTVFYAVRAAGIAAYNARQIDGECVNRGKITAQSKENFVQVAGIAAYCASSGLYAPALSSCRNEGEIYGKSERSFAYVAGVVAYGKSTTLSSCVNAESGSVTMIVTDSVLSDHDSICGGVAGYAGSSVANCTNQGSVSAQAVIPTQYIGGVAGAASGTVSGCAQEGSVVATGNASSLYVGGAVGYAASSLSSDVSSGNVDVTNEKADGKSYVGGVAGHAGSVVQACSSSCTVSGESHALLLGGIFGGSGYFPTMNYGANYYAAYSCAFTGILTGAGETVEAGGVAGELAHVVYGCKTSGTVSATGTNAYGGGIAGVMTTHTTENGMGGGTVYSGKAVRCASSSSLSATATVAFLGGMAGYVTEWVYSSGDTTLYFGGGATECYFTGALETGEGLYRGTIAGGCDASVYQDNEGGHFSDNFYVAQETPAFAVGVYKNGDVYEEGSGVGATAATVEQIENDETYQSILQAFTKS